jgi:hypothetical protein
MSSSTRPSRAIAPLPEGDRLPISNILELLNNYLHANGPPGQYWLEQIAQASETLKSLEYLSAGLASPASLMTRFCSIVKEIYMAFFTDQAFLVPLPFHPLSWQYIFENFPHHSMTISESLTYWRDSLNNGLMDSVMEGGPLSPTSQTERLRTIWEDKEESEKSQEEPVAARAGTPMLFCTEPATELESPSFTVKTVSRPIAYVSLQSSDEDDDEDEDDHDLFRPAPLRRQNAVSNLEQAGAAAACAAADDAPSTKGAEAAEATVIEIEQEGDTPVEPSDFDDPTYENKSSRTARSYVATVNNPSEDVIAAFRILASDDNLLCSKIVVGQEVGEKGTPHLQVYFTLKESVRRAFVKNIKIHLEDGTMVRPFAKCYFARALKGPVPNHRYCTKSGNFFQKWPLARERKGKKVSLDEALAKYDTLEEFHINNMGLFARYHAGVICHYDMMTKAWTGEVKAYYIHGPSGCGKNTVAHWLVTQMEPRRGKPAKAYMGQTAGEKRNPWLLSYSHERAWILGEFRANAFHLPWLLSMCDKGEKVVNRKGGVAKNCIEMIILCSIHPPDVAFAEDIQRGEDIEQFFRRFTVMNLERDPDILKNCLGDDYDPTYEERRRETRTVNISSFQDIKKFLEKK